MSAAALEAKAFAWDESLHPRDDKGRFIRTWRELFDAFRKAKKADDDFDRATQERLRAFDDVVQGETYLTAPHHVQERDRLEVALVEAEHALEVWLTADKGLEVVPPEPIRRAFYLEPPAKAERVASRPSGILPSETEKLRQRAFEKYSADSVRLDINDSLRRGTEPSDPLNANVIKIMDATFRDVPPTAEPAVAYRGLSMAEPPEVGDVIVDQGYSSMIGDPREAIGFALGRSAGAGQFAQFMEGEPTGHPPVLMEILIPPGSHLVTDGWETVTPRGSSFEVVGRSDNGTLIAVLRTRDRRAEERERLREEYLAENPDLAQRLTELAGARS